MLSHLNRLLAGPEYDLWFEHFRNNAHMGDIGKHESDCNFDVLARFGYKLHCKPDGSGEEHEMMKKKLKMNDGAQFRLQFFIR